MAMNGRTALMSLLLLVTVVAAARPIDSLANLAGSSFAKARNGKTLPSLPVVLWHGMGDSCCASYSIGHLKDAIADKLGVFVHSIATGESPLADVWSSYFGNVNDQVAKVCEQLRSMPELKDGYNAIGFSQGGLFMRAAVQRCQHLGPKASILITLGGPQQGVANIPGCSTVPGNLTGEGELEALGDGVTSRSACETMQTILGKGAYMAWVRDHVVQAQYFKDPAHHDQYLRYSPFLPDINNERDDKVKQYADNLASLEQLVLYRFADDTIVVPRDSTWFSTYNENRELIPLEEQPLYKEDWLGLKRLQESGRLQLLEAPGQHMQFSMDWFEASVIWGHLAGADAPGANAAV